MAPIKFEEQLKEKLEKRTIKPSTEAWDALANRLDNHEKKHNHRSLWWLGIAASIVGIFLATTFIFDSSESETVTPVIVKTPNSNEVKDDAVVSTASEPVIKASIDKPKPELNLANKVKPETVKPKPTPSFNSVQTELQEAVALNDINEVHDAMVLDSPANHSDFEQAKLNEVVAEINKLKAENAVVSEAEIDSLLKQAEREILTNRIYNQNTKTVDANALLQDVEADLEQSFRTRVFEALINNYETVKTAVAERNN